MEASNSSTSILRDNNNLTIEKKLESFSSNKIEKPVLIQKVQDLVNYFNLKNLEPVQNTFQNTATGYNPIPLVTRNGKVFVPQSSVNVPSYPVRCRGDIILKPTRIGTHPKTHIELPADNLHMRSKQCVKYDSKNTATKQRSNGVFTDNIRVETDEFSLQNKNVQKTFPAEAFSKNLKKVLNDVLGSSNVKAPTECIINKPKTFVKRIGSGDECKNTASLYLPPRAFGCGPTEHMAERYINSNKKPGDSSFLHANIFKLPTNQLPPFSKKTITFSKSDGNIESIECVKKIGGSDESFRKKSHYLPFDSKPRPHVAFKRPFSTDKKK